MALSQSDLTQLLQSLRTADGVETIKMLCERILQELIKAEATEVIGAARGEHSETRATWRNRPRTIASFHHSRNRISSASDYTTRRDTIGAGEIWNVVADQLR